jgi:uncharacterized membrane protein YeaQ/YmgE (transglycosylase-associated protein family)
MELVITLGLGGWAILIVGSLIFGGIAQVVGETRTGYEWLVDAIAAGIGALVGRFIVPGRRLARSSTDSRSMQALVSLVVGLVVGSRRDSSPAALTPGRCPPELSQNTGGPEMPMSWSAGPSRTGEA